MNCKQGDLAVVVRSSGPAFDFLLGRVVECKQLTHHPVFRTPGWYVGSVIGPDGVVWGNSIGDEFLKPLRGGDGTDEVIRRVGRPQDVEQPDPVHQVLEEMRS